MMNQIEDAIRHLEQAAKLIEKHSPNKAEHSHSGAYGEHVYHVFVGLGIALQLNERYEESVKQLKKAVKMQPPRFSACNSLGLTYDLMGKYSDALEAYDQALQRYVNEVISRWEAETGKKLTEPRQIDGKKTLHLNTEYLAMIHDALRSEPIYATLQNNMGSVYLEMGDLSTAKEKFEESIDFIPKGYDYPNPYNGLSRIAEESEDGNPE